MTAPQQRTAWLAGASGLVGHALLPLLLRGHASVTVLARRELPGRPADARLHLRLVDFARLPADLPAVDDAFITLGTTIKAAGSEAAFRAVDYDAVVAVARAARQAGATRLAIVSALGADSASRIFYNRVKGDMEAAVASLGFATVTVAQPSLLVGDRAALGQRERPGEVWTMRLVGPLMGLVPQSLRPIRATDVAAALVAATRAGRPGVQVLHSRAMQGAVERP